MQDQNQLQRKVDAQMQVMRILWFGLVISVVLYLVMTLLIGRPKNPQPNAALSLGLLAFGIVFVVVSIPVKMKLLSRAVEQQSVMTLQQGFIFAMALCEVAALFGLLDFFITGNPYYYANFIIAFCGQLYHLPRRQHLLDASYRTPTTAPTPAYGEPVTRQNQTGPSSPPEL